MFPCEAWLSKTMGDKQISKEFSASVGGKSVLSKTSYRITVKTSNIRGAGTGANVSCIVFGKISIFCIRLSSCCAFCLMF